MIAPKGQVCGSEGPSNKKLGREGWFGPSGQTLSRFCLRGRRGLRTNQADAPGPFLLPELGPGSALSRLPPWPPAPLAAGAFQLHALWHLILSTAPRGWMRTE